MIYEKDKIKRLIEYKDNLIDPVMSNDIEWLIGCYNEYFINAKEYEEQRRNYKNIENKYYNAEEEKAILQETIVAIKRKYKALKEEVNGSCKKRKDMI